MAAPGNHAFGGRIGRTREESEPWWPPARTAKAGRPNIVVLYMDDMGFADIGCYGSEIETPNIDSIAARGVRFNHYTTHPICSPARAALLTGRNAHAVGTGWLANTNPGFPGYSGDIPLAAQMLPETLRAAGYATIGIGKWHNSNNATTPNETWPAQRGFDRFYGFLEGETSYFFPARIVVNNVVAPIDTYPPDYYATDDWTDQALRLMRDARNEKATQPIFLYLAFNAVHGPLQAKEADLAKYRGRYDRGWDELRAERLARQKSLGIVPPDAQLSPRDPAVPAWKDVPADQRALFARHMETYAAMLDCVDQNVGRLLALLDELGERDDTILVFSSDNGGTSSAGPTGAVHFNRRFAGLPTHPVSVDLARAPYVGSGRVSALYPMGWGQVSNVPFPSFKTFTGGGGRRVCLIASYPRRIDGSGRISDRFAHVTDLMPTLLDLAQVPALAQSHGEDALAFHGSSLAEVLQQASATSPRREQYYECWANRAYYRDGWIAVSLQKKGEPIDFDNWTLHRHDNDFSESVDLAAVEPARLAELVEAFDKAAWSNAVYPLDSRSPLQKFNQLPPHLRPAPESRRRFLPGGQSVHRSVIVPLIADRNFRILVRVHQPANGEGVLFAIGDVTGGVVMSIEAGHLNCFYNGFGDWTQMAPIPMPFGEQVVGLEYEALGGRKGRGRLVVTDGAGDARGAWQDLSPTMMTGFHEGLDIGIDRRGPVDWELWERRGSFAYTGALVDLVVESGAFAPGSAYAVG